MVLVDVGVVGGIVVAFVCVADDDAADAAAAKHMPGIYVYAFTGINLSRSPLMRMLSMNYQVHVIIFFNIHSLSSITAVPWLIFRGGKSLYSFGK